MKKLLVPTLLGVLSLAYYGSSWPRAANGAQDDTAKTAREMTHIVMEEHDGRDKAFIVNTLPTGGEGIPPWANVLNDKKNFLPCRGGPLRPLLLLRSRRHASLHGQKSKEPGKERRRLQLHRGSLRSVLRRHQCHHGPADL